MKNKFLSLVFILTANIGIMFAWDYEQVQIGMFYYNLDATNLIAELVPKPSGAYSLAGSSTLTIRETVEYNSITYTVTSIGDRAFYNNTVLTTVIIPNNITNIGVWAFNGCTNLKSVSIPNSVRSIGTNAFYGCTSLPVVNNIRYAGPYLVEATQKTLFIYSIREGTKWIGTNAFSSCEYLTSITIPNSVISIEAGAFAFCKKLTEVKMGNSITDIKEGAFTLCPKLTNITLPDGLTNIEGGAFISDSALISINIPKTVTYIGQRAFENCVSLTSVHINDLDAWINIKYESLNGPLREARHLYLNGEEVTKVVFPEGISEIGAEVFDHCLSLTEVTIPQSVANIGGGAFRYCENLKSMTCMASKPPVCERFALTNSIKVNVYVPKESVDLYKTADSWKSHTILPIETPTNIGNSIIRDRTESKQIHNGQLFIQRGDEVFNAQGARVK